MNNKTRKPTVILMLNFTSSSKALNCSNKINLSKSKHNPIFGSSVTEDWGNTVVVLKESDPPLRQVEPESNQEVTTAAKDVDLKPQALLVCLGKNTQENLITFNRILNSSVQERHRNNQEIMLDISDENMSWSDLYFSQMKGAMDQKSHHLNNYTSFKSAHQIVGLGACTDDNVVFSIASLLVGLKEDIPLAFGTLPLYQMSRYGVGHEMAPILRNENFIMPLAFYSEMRELEPKELDSILSQGLAK